MKIKNLIRYMHTTQEHRQNIADIEEHGIHMVRGARRGRNLPTAYDDFWRDNSRSWKDQSKARKQWQRKK